jgi:hypothetical protein
MRTVFIRTDVNIDETPSTYEHAETICGIKLDRRKKYLIMFEQVHEWSSWTQECSGCDGGGCFECGGCGKRISGCWSPVIIPKEPK